jgi:acyl carrier protein
MLEKIIQLLEDHFVFDDQEITIESDLRMELYLDDLDMENLVIALEDEFDLDLSNLDADYLFTVEDIVNVVSGKTTEK